MIAEARQKLSSSEYLALVQAHAGGEEAVMALLTHSSAVRMLRNSENIEKVGMFATQPQVPRHAAPTGGLDSYA